MAGASRCFFDSLPDKANVTRCFTVVPDRTGETVGILKGQVIAEGDAGGMVPGSGAVWMCKEKTPTGLVPFRIDADGCRVVVQRGETGTRLRLTTMTPDGREYGEWSSDGDGETWGKVSR